VLSNFQFRISSFSIRFSDSTSDFQPENIPHFREKCKLMDEGCQILENRSEPYIHNALKDPSSRVRAVAVLTYEEYDKIIFSKALSVIRKLMQEDPDEAVRHYAKYVLKHYGVGDIPE